MSSLPLLRFTWKKRRQSKQQLVGRAHAARTVEDMTLSHTLASLHTSVCCGRSASPNLFISLCAACIPHSPTDTATEKLAEAESRVRNLYEENTRLTAHISVRGTGLQGWMSWGRLTACCSAAVLPRMGPDCT